MNTAAYKLIPKPNNTVTTIKKNGDTDDIISTILFADKQAAQYTKAFAPTLKGNTVLETAHNIWNFLKQEINYKDDGFSFQNIKSPSQFYWDKTGDCKSYSVFTASVLQNIYPDLNYCFRFASFSNSETPTHVYIVIPKNKKYNPYSEIIIDGVWIAFNQQKTFTHKKDFKGMTQINYVAGIGETKGLLQLPSANKEWTDADIELAIIQQRAEIMQSRLAGIGATARADKFEDAIEAIKDIRKHLYDDDRVGIILQDVELKNYNSSKHISQLLNEEQKFLQRLAIIKLRDVNQYARTKQGKLNEYENRIKLKQERAAKLATELTATTDVEKQKQINDAITRNNATLQTLLKIRDEVAVAGIGNVSVNGFFSNVLKKASTAVKKATKAVVNVATAPAKLIAKGVLEISLPKAAPAFLYLFVTDPALIAKLSPKAQAKRAKQVRKADFIVNSLGMKRSHFMGIVRNGIMKRYGKQPEQVIAELLKVSKVSGIGFAPAILAAGSMLNSKDAQGKNQLLGILNELISLVTKLFGKKDSENLTADDLPDESDFTSIGDKEALALGNSITAQAPNMDSEDMSTDGAADGGRGWCNW